MLLFLFLDMIDNENDKNKFTLVYNEYMKPMFYMANRILKDEYLAEDAVSQSFEKIIQNITKIDEVYSPTTKSYVVRICKNKAIDIFRKRRRNNEVPFDEVEYELSVDKEVDEIEKLYGGNENEVLLKAIANLPPKYLNVVSMKYNNDYSYSEIAEELGLTLDNVRQVASRAKKKIAEYMAENE